MEEGKSFSAKLIVTTFATVARCTQIWFEMFGSISSTSLVELNYFASIWTPYLIYSYLFVMMINITRPFCSVNFSKGSDFYTHTIIHILLAMVMFFRWQNDYGWLLILLLESHLLKQYCNYSIIAISIYVKMEKITKANISS